MPIANLLIFFLWCLVAIQGHGVAQAGSLRKVYQVKDSDFIALPGKPAGYGCIREDPRVIPVKRRTNGSARRLYARQLLSINLALQQASGAKADTLQKRLRRLRRNYRTLKAVCIELWRQRDTLSSASSSASSSNFPSCGDGHCLAPETTHTCPADCPAFCLDSDGDGYGSGIGCLQTQDCDDSQATVNPAAVEICHNNTDDNCNSVRDEQCECSSYTAQFECNYDQRRVGQCLWVDDSCVALPQDCPRVFADSSGHLVVDGELFFPIGFWSHYFAQEPQGYGSHFTGLVDGASPLFDFVEATETANKVKMFAQSAVSVQDGEIVPWNVLNFGAGRNVIAWEVMHEPDYYSHYVDGQWVYDSPGADVEHAAHIIRSSDPCHRPVFLTPTISGAVSQYLSDHISFVDLVGVQAGYRTPSLDIRGTGENIAQAVARAQGKPIFLVMRVSGYQPARLRYRARQPTPDEVRVQAYHSIIRGASGVFFYAYAKGISRFSRLAGIAELPEAEFSVVDSPESLDSMKAVAAELNGIKPVLASAVSARLSASPDAQDIECQVRNDPDPSAEGAYLLCVNLGENVSSIFEARSGDEVRRYKAQLIGSGGVMAPGYECQDSLDNDLDGQKDAPSLYQEPPGDSDDGCCSEADDDESHSGWVYQVSNHTLTPDKTGIVNVSPPLGWNDRQVSEIHMPVVYASANTALRFGLYADSNRDSSPDSLVSSTGWHELTSLVAPGVYAFALPETITLQHDLNYYLLVQTSKPITLLSRDMRSGVRFRQAWAGDFPAFFDELHQPKAVQANIGLSGSISSCEVKKSPEEQFIPCSNWNSTSIQDQFAGYGVHIYRLNQPGG